MKPETKGKNEEDQPLVQNAPQNGVSTDTDTTPPIVGRSEKEKREARITQARRFGLDAPLFGL